MENVQNVYVTAEVAEMLDYQPIHIIRTAKSLLERNIITKKEFRSAGPRTYLFSEEAVKQLKIEFDCPILFLTRIDDEEPREVQSIRYSELKVSSEDLIIFNDEEEKQKFQSLQKALVEEGEEDEYEEFINEKQYLHEMIDSEDSYGWVSYVNLDNAIREERAYFIKNLELIPVQIEELKRMTVLYESSIVEDAVTKISDGFFKSETGDYYRLVGTNNEVELIDIEGYRMKYWQMKIEDALEQIQADFGLEIQYERVSYWDSVPVLLTKNNEKVEVKEVGVEGGMAMLKYRNISEILDDVERLTSRS